METDNVAGIPDTIEMLIAGLATACVVAFATIAFFVWARDMALATLLWVVRMLALGFGWGVVAIVILPIWFVNWVWPFEPEYLKRGNASSRAHENSMDNANISRGSGGIQEQSPHGFWVDRRLLRAQATAQFPDYAPVFDATD